MVRLPAHLKANKLNGNNFPCPALLTLSWTPQGSKLGGGLGLILRPRWFSHTSGGPPRRKDGPSMVTFFRVFNFQPDPSKLKTSKKSTLPVSSFQLLVGPFKIKNLEERHHAWPVLLISWWTTGKYERTRLDAKSSLDPPCFEP